MERSNTLDIERAERKIKYGDAEVDVIFRKGTPGHTKEEMIEAMEKG